MYELQTIADLTPQQLRACSQSQLTYAILCYGHPPTPAAPTDGDATPTGDGDTTPRGAADIVPAQVLPQVRVPTDLTPNFDLKHILTRLKTMTDETDILRTIRGIHERFWHAPPSRLLQLLEPAGIPKLVLDLIQKALSLIHI